MCLQYSNSIYLQIKRTVFIFAVMPPFPAYGITNDVPRPLLVTTQYLQYTTSKTSAITQKDLTVPPFRHIFSTAITSPEVTTSLKVVTATSPTLTTQNKTSTSLTEHAGTTLEMSSTPRKDIITTPRTTRKTDTCRTENPLTTLEMTTTTTNAMITTSESLTTQRKKYSSSTEISSTRLEMTAISTKEMITTSYALKTQSEKSTSSTQNPAITLDMITSTTEEIFTTSRTSATQSGIHTPSTSMTTKPTEKMITTTENPRTTLDMKTDETTSTNPDDTTSMKTTSIYSLSTQNEISTGTFRNALANTPKDLTDNMSSIDALPTRIGKYTSPESFSSASQFETTASGTSSQIELLTYLTNSDITLEDETGTSSAIINDSTINMLKSGADILTFSNLITTESVSSTMGDLTLQMADMDLWQGN